MILESVYHTLDGPSWIRRDRWLSSLDVCVWYGVRCNTNGVVNYLNISHNNAAGNIPSLAGLSLQTLDISHNRITSLPSDLVSFNTILTTVHANDNLITTLPSNIFASVLSELYLANNPLGGQLPDQTGPTKLTKLGLENTGLTTLPLYIAQSITLTTLLLDYNELTVFPAMTCSALKQLAARHNYLTDISGLESCHVLQTLNLEFNGIRDVAVLASLQAVTSINLNHNTLLAVNDLVLPSKLAMLLLNNNFIYNLTISSSGTNLMMVDLSYNFLNCFLISGVVSHIFQVDLSHNYINDECDLCAGLPHASLSQQIYHFDISYNLRTYLDIRLLRAPFLILHLSGANNQLNRLVSFADRDKKIPSLSSCFQRDVGIAATTFWLDVSSNQFSGDLWQFLSCTSGVIGVDASDNVQITTSTTSALLQNVKLISLDIANTTVHNVFDSSLGNLLYAFPLLSNVDVSDCPIKCIPAAVDTMLPLSVTRITMTNLSHRA